MRTTVLGGAILLLLSGCASLVRTGPACECSPITGAWATALKSASDLAEAGRFEAADSVLLAFADGNAGSHHAREVVFWRALYQVDPRNPSPHPVEAAQLLDSYLLSDSVYWYRTEARLVRQLAAMQSTTVAAMPPPQRPVTPTVTVPITRAGDATITDKDVEIQQLRERVARLNEELERIKRRLSTP